MGNCKIILFIVYTLLTGLCQAQQRPVIYAGFDYFRNSGFDNNLFGNLNLGFQIYQFKFLAPEVGFNYHFGDIQDSKRLNAIDPQARAPRISDGKYGAAVFSISPKLVFGDSQAALVIIPQYNFGTIRTRGNFLVDNGDIYLLDEQIKHSELLSFWSFAAGVQGNFFDLEYLFFSVFLKYTLFNSSEAFNAISQPIGYPNLNKGAADGIGIGAKVYFDFFQILNKK